MRESLSRGLEAELRDLVVRGVLAPGGRINEVHLARDLGVSRTPLREALTRLAGESFLEAKPHRGFFVRALSADELHQLYVIRARLDPFALELAGIPIAAVIAELRALNRELRAAAGDVSTVIALDDEWHLRLLAGCENPVLLGLIEQMMWRTRRYEFIYLASGENVAVAGDQHEQILERLEAGDVEGATCALSANMTTAIEPLLAWIERTQ